MFSLKKLIFTGNRDLAAHPLQTAPSRCRHWIRLIFLMLPVFLFVIFGAGEPENHLCSFVPAGKTLISPTYHFG